MPHVLHEIFYNEAVEGEEGKEKSRIPTESAINEEYTSIEQSNKEEVKNEGYISDEKCNCQDCQIEDFLAQYPSSSRFQSDIRYGTNKGAFIVHKGILLRYFQKNNLSGFDFNFRFDNKLYNIKNVCADLYIDEVRSLKSMTVEFIGQVFKKMWSEYTITWYAHNHCGVHHPLVSKKTLHVWADAILLGFGCMEQVDWNYERLEELHEDLVIHLKKAIYLFLNDWRRLHIEVMPSLLSKSRMPSTTIRIN